MECRTEHTTLLLVVLRWVYMRLWVQICAPEEFLHIKGK